MALALMPARADHRDPLDRLGDEIAELSAHLDAATARLLDLIREFDARKGWGLGFHSCAHWLNWRVGLALGPAREKVRVARALGDLPALRDALAQGELSYSKVRALTRIATPATEARLLALGRAGTTAHVERIVRGWRRCDRREEARETGRRHDARGLTLTHDDDGMVIVRGRLEPEVGALLQRALAAAREALYRRARAVAAAGSADPSGEAPTVPQRQADALVLIAEAALAHELDPGAPGERYQVVVHVDEPVLNDPDAPGQSLVEGGAHVSAETSRRVACDASVVRMRHAPDGQILDVGRRTRTIPPAIRRALLHRDKTCRFPGCHVRAGQGHHLRHWANGGPTSLHNLALLCRRHHRAVHEEGFQVERAPDGELRFRWPDGRPLPEAPTPPRVPANPDAALRAGNAAAGVTPGARTACPSWGGERLDEGYALDVLRPAAGPRALPRPPRDDESSAAAAAPAAAAPAPASSSWEDDWSEGFLSMVGRRGWS